MDKYGFLLDDNRATRRTTISSNDGSCTAGSSDPVSVGSGSAADERNAKRWEEILDKLDPSNLRTNSTTQPHPNIQSEVKNYARQGLPDELRQKAWTILTDADLLMYKHPVGKYEMLVEHAEEEWVVYELERTVDDHQGKKTKTSPFRKVLDAIEKDVNRTFPKHYLFHNGSSLNDMLHESPATLSVDIGSASKIVDESLRTQHTRDTTIDDDDDDDEDEDGSIEIEEDWADFPDDDSIATAAQSLGTDPASLVDEKKRMFTQNLSRSMRSLVDRFDALSTDSSDGENDDEDSSPLTYPLGGYIRMGSCQSGASGTSSVETLGIGEGRDALRRVLRAYSLYDTDIGYCQGMNFIAAMFLTFLSEEESFWLLVVVMNNKPYKLRELFAEDMRGTLELLYIAEKLLAQFLPRLSKHLDAEGIHVSMFITQWLLTVYTSTFPFALVVRVWDSFLVEGWKVIYRVMLSLLDSATDDILGMCFEEILAYLKDFPSTVNVQEIMDRSIKIALKGKHIQKHVTEWRRHASGAPQGNGSNTPGPSATKSFFRLRSSSSADEQSLSSQRSSVISKLNTVKFDGQVSSHYMGNSAVFIQDQSTSLNKLCHPRRSSLVQKNNPRPEPKRRHSVSFASVSIREYERILGDNPSVTDGPPIGIGWRHAPEKEVNVDEYEFPKGEEPRIFLLDRSARENMLREHTNISDKEMVTAVKAIRKDKWQRHKTVVNLNMQKAEEKAEGAKRKAQKMLNKSLSHEVLQAKLWHNAHEIAKAKAQKLEESIMQGESVSGQDLYSVGTPLWSNGKSAEL